MAGRNSAIPLLSLKQQYKSIGKDLRRAALRVLDSGVYILGPEGRAFEAEFARALGARHAIGLSSGTTALELGLKALGIGPGDEVVVPSFSFIATATAVSAIGARPVFADVDEATLTLGPAQLEAAFTPRSKAVIPVHLYGQPADMDGLLEIARRRGLRVLEDCAQAHLTLYKGRAAGTLGDMAAFSFYPSKNLGALGDAGALVTRDEALASACLELRNAGRPKSGGYEHVRVGYNARLDELQAALLRVKLKRLRSWTGKRRRLAALYNRELAGLPLSLPELGSGGNRHSFHLYVVRGERRDGLAAHLKAAGIGSGVVYPAPIHLQPAYAGLGDGAGSCPVAEQASRSVLALPLYPELPPASVLRVCATIRAFFK